MTRLATRRDPLVSLTPMIPLLLGALAFARSCGEIEEAARRGAADAVGDLLPVFERELERLLPALRALAEEG